MEPLGSSVLPTSSSLPSYAYFPTSSSVPSGVLVLEVKPLNILPPPSWFRSMSMHSCSNSNDVPSMAAHSFSHLPPPGLSTQVYANSASFPFQESPSADSSSNSTILNVAPLNCFLPTQSSSYKPAQWVSSHHTPIFPCPGTPPPSGTPPPVTTPTQQQDPTEASAAHTPPSSSHEHSTPSNSRTRSHVNDRNSRKRYKPSTEAGSSSGMLQSPLHVTPALTNRESVEKTLMVYHAIKRRLLQKDDAQRKPEGDSRVKRFHAYLKAGAIMNERGLKLNEAKRVGAIPGVQVGDMYCFRMEMCVVGLHSPIEAGIDYMTARFEQAEESVAISIVSSSGHEGDIDDGEVLIYTGHGGHKKGEKFTDDQKLVRGNLALDRSMHRAVDIRVTRGFKDRNHPTRKVYIYDGLYRIIESWMEKNNEGFYVYKYKLVRQPGQPTSGCLIWKLTQRWKLNTSSRDGALVADISFGVEKKPICVVNEVDDQRGPLQFMYITEISNSGAIRLSKTPCACKCIPICLPCDGGCSCIHANNNEFPYVDNGSLIRRLPVVYECGMSCLCSLACPNRVSQKGVIIHFEVFKTQGRGWGLRSWDFIPTGAFICEYVGEVTTRKRIEDDDGGEYVFDSDRVGADWIEWDGMCELCGEERTSISSTDMETISVVINARKAGNVSRFMNHSCSPNVFWQIVVYDENGSSYPHVMFFALKSIPPLTELTFDYGVSKGPEGEEGDDGGWGLRRKKCLCGAPNCRGHFG